MEYTRAKPWPFFMYRSLIAVNCSYKARTWEKTSAACLHSSCPPASDSCVWLDLLFQPCPRFQAYIAARRPRLAVGRKTNRNILWIKQLIIELLLKSSGSFFFWVYLSVRVFYCGVILLHKNALHKLDCLKWTNNRKENIKTVTSQKLVHALFHSNLFSNIKITPSVYLNVMIHRQHSALN